MLHRHAFEAVDRSMRDIMHTDALFGGKVVVLGGDFRQTPPIVRRGGKDAVVKASLRRSRLYPLLQRLPLTVNMRVERAVAAGNPAAAALARAWAEFLLRLGDGRKPFVPRAGELRIRLPDNVVFGSGAPAQLPYRLLAVAAPCPEFTCLPAAEEPLDLLQWTYGELTQPGAVANVQRRAVPAPKNKDVDDLNATATARFPGLVRPPHAPLATVRACCSSLSPSVVLRRRTSTSAPTWRTACPRTSLWSS